MNDKMELALEDADRFKVVCAGLGAVIIVSMIILSGCAAIRDACREEQLIPMVGGGYQVIPRTCP